ncbi:MAG TPA: hypothetical protein VGW40_03455 [Allosphingosinicella sp.]|nr:hypothetical protein [Allosphingosinicella sp.]
MAATFARALDPYALLYSLIVFMLPLVWFVAGQAIAAIIAHHTLKLYIRRESSDADVVRAANARLREQNRRLLTANALLLAECERERLKRRNRRLARRARRAELRLAALAAGAARARDRAGDGGIAVRH